MQLPTHARLLIITCLVAMSQLHADTKDGKKMVAPKIAIVNVHPYCSR